MSIIDLANPDLERLVMAEVELSRRLQEQTWDQHGDPGSAAWRVAMPSDSEVHKVVLDGTALTEKFSVAGCHGTADTFFYDDLAKELYVHTSGSDDPATLDGGDPKYSIVAYFWEAFSNRPKSIERFDDLLKYKNGSLEIWTTTTNATDVTESVSGASTIAQSSYAVGEVYDSDSAWSAKITIDGAANAAYIQWAVSTMSRRKHKVRLKYHATGAASVYIFDSGTNVYLNTSGEWVASGACIALPSTSGAWVEKELEFVTHSSYNDYIIRIRCATASAVVYVDNVELHRYRREQDCHAFLPAGRIPSIQQSVGDFHQPDVQMAFGKLSLLNDGWFWDRYSDDSYLWHNRKVRLWVGLPDSTYDELVAFGTGRTREPKWGANVEIEMLDERVMLNSIPINRYGGAPVEESWRGRLKPVLMGLVERITPPCINTGTFVYQFTDITFNGSAFNANALTAVYKDDVLQTEGGGNDYTKDLSAGTFTMNADPAGAKITCDATGIDHSIAHLGSGTAALTLNLYFLYANLCNLSPYDLHIRSLMEMIVDRNIPIGHWVDSSVAPEDVLILWKKSACFHTFVTLAGKHYFRYYDSAVPSGTPHFWDEDYLSEPRIISDTDQCYKEIVVRAFYRPDDADYLYEESDSENNVEYEHDIKETRTFDTVLIYQASAQTLAANYLAMFKNPVEILTVTLGAAALTLNPSDKAYFTYTQKDDDGNVTTILDETVYTILSLEKDLNRGEVRIRAMKDVADFFWAWT